MDANALKALQAPIKERYRETPDAAVVTLRAEGTIGEGVTCSVQTSKAMIEAGLHPATGGTGFRPAPATCCSRRWSPVRALR